LKYPVFTVAGDETGYEDASLLQDEQEEKLTR
jgi:hypothetical protein